MGLFNKKTTISMEFCSDRVKVVVGRYQKKNITIDKCFSIPIPEDLYEDGIIKDTNKYLYELERGLSENKVTRGDVYGVINSSNIIIREISIPKVGANQIGAILNYQLDEYLPVDPQAYVVQYLPLDTVEENGVEKQNLMLIGVPKSIIEPHFNLLQNLGLKPLVLDYAGNAITKLIRFNDSINGVYDKNITIACVDLEHESTTLNIIEKGMMSISRVVKEEIRPIIYEDAALTSDEAFWPVEGNEPFEQDNSAVSGLKRNLGVILDGIDIVFRYYSSRETENDIDLILLHGYYSNIDGIENLIGNFFEIPCVKLNVLDKVKFYGDLADYANAIGGLIRVSGVK
ncbi:MAG TPA: pilus assembly protein PilM [Sedimentibacter sp.]|nr:pilus assembly protein PilM [Sedimentibacter sp.]HRC81186.1 pilus assembly protein PilM [Sedimentibacter sp.]